MAQVEAFFDPSSVSLRLTLLPQGEKGEPGPTTAQARSARLLCIPWFSNSEVASSPFEGKKARLVLPEHENPAMIGPGDCAGHGGG